MNLKPCKSGLSKIKSKKGNFRNISHNDTTLNSYELGISRYIDNTAQEISGIVKEWVDDFLKIIPKNAQILEVGSAFGRDAKYIESNGFSVERTDATLGFVTYLNNAGHQAYSFNILTDKFKSSYDLIFANAVFLHFTPEELESVLRKTRASLHDEGILAFSIKHGEGEEWTSVKVGNPRYFCYWKKEKIQALLELTGFEMISLSEDDKFLQITAKRKQVDSL